MLGGEARARHDEADGAFRKLEPNTGADDGALTRSETHGLGGDQVGTSVARLGIRGEDARDGHIYDKAHRTSVAEA